MPWQLIYTSAARGLTPGQSGYCTVARSRDLRESLVPRLEKFSYYTPEKNSSPIICAHRIVDLRGAQYHVLTRICDAGLDFTKRGKFLAHHLVFERNELTAIPSPALLFLKWKGWLEHWEGGPTWLNDTPPVNLEDRRPSAWEKLTGSSANATALTSGWFTGNEQERKLFLELLHESLIASGKPWDRSFTNCFQPGDEVNDFQIRAVWPETPGWGAANEITNLRDLRATRVLETPTVSEEPPSPPPAEAPVATTRKINPLWFTATAAAAVLALVASIFYARRAGLKSEKRTPPLVQTQAAPSFQRPIEPTVQNVDELFPATPTWLAAGDEGLLGPAPALDQIFKSLRDSDLFGKDIHVKLNGVTAAVDARPQQNLLLISTPSANLEVESKENICTLRSKSTQPLTLDLESGERFIFTPNSAVLQLSRAFLTINTNTQTATLKPDLDARLRRIILPKGDQLALRPRPDFLREMEEEFALAPSTLFDLSATRAQVKHVLHDIEKRAAERASEAKKLREEERKLVLDPKSPADQKRKERLRVLDLAIRLDQKTVKDMREKADRVPKDFSTLHNFSIFLCDEKRSAEIIRFGEEAP